MWLILLTLYINCVLRLYLFIWLCYRKLVCVAHFDVWKLALSRIISMMTTDLLLLLFERNRPKRLSHTDKKRQSFKIQSKYFSQTKRPHEARVCVFVLRCSASVTAASHSWMLYLIQNFTCVYMSHQFHTCLLPNKNKEKRQNHKKTQQHVKSVLLSVCLETKINMLTSESAHHY